MRKRNMTNGRGRTGAFQYIPSRQCIGAGCAGLGLDMQDWGWVCEVGIGYTVLGGVGIGCTWLGWVCMVETVCTGLRLGVQGWHWCIGLNIQIWTRCTDFSQGVWGCAWVCGVMSGCVGLQVDVWD